jgi:hypothetical protein
MIPSVLTGHRWSVDSTQHVFYIGADMHVHEHWFHQGSGWHHNDLTGAAQAPTVVPE